MWRRILDDPTLLVRKPLEWFGIALLYAGVVIVGVARFGDQDFTADLRTKYTLPDATD